MALTNFPNGISSFGIPSVGTAPLNSGKYFFVNGTTGADGNAGTSSRKAFRTVQSAVNDAALWPGSVVLIAPGVYDETVTIARPAAGSSYMTLFGMGNRGDVRITPSTTNAGAMLNHADDTTLVNISATSNGTGTSLVNSGTRLRANQCRFSNTLSTTGLAVNMLRGTAAQVTALTNGTASDGRFTDCTFSFAATGLTVSCTDGGAITNLVVDGCRFHDIGTGHVTEVVVAGGAAAATHFGLCIRNCSFERDSAGAQPTKYILLNASNVNNGIVYNCYFPTAIAGGLNLVSTLLFWIGNLHIAGIAGAQPS